MLISIVKGFLIGISASVPLGPCAIMILQRSLSRGRRAGFVTGLGATTVDTTWAAVSIFALALAEQFIDANQSLIYLIGGLIVALIGASMVFQDPRPKSKTASVDDGMRIRYYVEALLTAFSNPAAVFVMLGLFAFFNVDTPDNTVLILPIIAAVALGSVCYWYCFSWVFSHLRKAFRMETILMINRLAGVIICIIGLIACVKGIIAVFFS